MEKRYSVILDAWYDLDKNKWIFEDETEKLYRDAADAIRRSIQRDLYLQCAKEHPIYHITGA
jgi:hypothetical protein